MSWDINQVVLVGRLTRDPEIRYSQSGVAVSSLSIAVGARKSSKRNDKENEVSYFDLISFGKTAELCSQYLSKGKQIAVLGSLQQRRWEDQSGQKRSKVEVVVSQVQFLSSPGGGSGQVYNEPETESVPETDANDFVGDDVPF